MSATLRQIQRLAENGDVRISVHGYEELADDDVSVRDLLRGIEAAVLVEDYPEYPKGPCCLVLQQDGFERLVHVVWGIPRGEPSPAALVTAYRPNPEKWDETWRRRRQ